MSVIYDTGCILTNYYTCLNVVDVDLELFDLLRDRGRRRLPLAVVADPVGGAVSRYLARII